MKKIIIPSLIGINLVLILIFSFFLIKNEWKENISWNLIIRDSLEKLLIDWSANVAPLVVQITAKDNSLYYQEENKTSVVEKDWTLKKWSGIIVSKKGYIITNKHVIDNKDLQYTVITSNGLSFPVKKIWTDAVIDIAVLSVEAGTWFESEAIFIEDNKNTAVWQFVLAIWNSLSEYTNTVSFWIISWKARKVDIDTTDSISYYAWLYQTDAALNPWNSWWPLVNLSGEIIGMITAISRWGNNIWFALPLNQKFIRSTLALIEQYNDIIRPYLGISYIDLLTWAKVDIIASDSPLSWYINVWDSITAIDNNTISLENPLLYSLYMYNPWDTIVFTVDNWYKKSQFSITLSSKLL